MASKKKLRFKKRPGKWVEVYGPLCRGDINIANDSVFVGPSSMFRGSQGGVWFRAYDQTAKRFVGLEA